MTDEVREQRLEDGEQTPEAVEPSVPVVSEPVVSEQATGDQAEDIEIPVQMTIEPGDTDLQRPEQEAEPVEQDEQPAVLEPPAPPEESPKSEEPPLTQAQRDIDQVVGLLLGEPQEAPPQESQLAEGEQVATVEPQPATDPLAQIPEPQPEFVPTVESVLEAILFATDEPLTDSKLAGIVETTTKQVHESIEKLNAKYTAENHAFRIEQIAGGYQMLTLNTYNSWLKKMLRARSDNKLSPAAMETLAIIAYKQPIIRADIEAIRGVAVGEVIRSLMYKGLVKIAGRAEILGRPMLYGTTKKFLEIFGLNSIKDLPKAEELKNPDRG